MMGTVAIPERIDLQLWSNNITVIGQTGSGRASPGTTETKSKPQITALGACCTALGSPGPAGGCMTARWPTPAAAPGN